MRRKVLTNYCDVFCSMFMGWRLAIQPKDIEELVNRGRGDIRIDVLTGRATVDDQDAELGIARELAAWLVDQARKDGVDLREVEHAVLEVDFSASERGTIVKHRDLQFACRAVIKTDEATYERTAGKGEAWSRRLGDNAWVVHDEPAE